MNFARKPMRIALPLVVGVLGVFGVTLKPVLAQEAASNVYQGDDIFEAVDDAQSIEREIDRIDQTREALQRRREVAASNAAYYADWEGQIAEQRAKIAEGQYVEQRLEYISRLEEYGPHLAASYPEYLRLLDAQLIALDLMETTGRAFIASGGQIADPSFAPARAAYQNYSRLRQDAEAFRSAQIGWRHMFAMASSRRIVAESFNTLAEAKRGNAETTRKLVAITRITCGADIEPDRAKCSEERFEALLRQADELEAEAARADTEADERVARALELEERAERLQN